MGDELADLVAHMDGRLRAGSEAGRQDAFLAAPTIQSHAAFLAHLENGDLACAWFGGTQEGMDDINIHWARLARGSDIWSLAEQLSADPVHSEQNPVLFTAPDGALHLLHTSQPKGNQDAARVISRVRPKGAADFGNPMPLDLPRGTFVRQPPALTDDGRWLLPLFLCRSAPGEKWAGDHDVSALAVSRDGGRSFEVTEVPGSLGRVHMNIIGLDDGRYAAFYRSRLADWVYRSISEDGGRSFSTPEPTDVPNNNSSIQVIALSDGRLAMVGNPVSAAMYGERRASLYDEIVDMADAGRSSAEGKAIWGVPRAPLTLSLSEDGGRSFPRRIDLATGSGYCLTNNSRDGTNRELSYPAILQAPDGGLDIAYTRFRRTIAHIRLSAEWLARQD